LILAGSVSTSQLPSSHGLQIIWKREVHGDFESALVDSDGLAVGTTGGRGYVVGMRIEAELLTTACKFEALNHLA
jgi:hypothetical protein